MDKRIISLTLLLIILILFPIVSACYTDAECASGGAWFVYGDKQVTRESCINGRCQIDDTMYVQCARDSDCGNGEVCQKSGSPSQWHCIKSTGEPNIQNTPVTNQESSNSSNSILIASIVIGICIVIGFIILAIVLRKKKK
jgi:Cys-rich repeat protein